MEKELNSALNHQSQEQSERENQEDNIQVQQQLVQTLFVQKSYKGENNQEQQTLQLETQNLSQQEEAKMDFVHTFLNELAPNQYQNETSQLKEIIFIQQQIQAEITDPEVQKDIQKKSSRGYSHNSEDANLVNHDEFQAVNNDEENRLEEDEDEDTFQLINSHISKWLIEDSVIIPPPVHILQDDNEVVPGVEGSQANGKADVMPSIKNVADGIFSGFPEISQISAMRKPQGNSKSLVNGQNPAMNRAAQNRPTDYSSDSPHPYYEAAAYSPKKNSMGSSADPANQNQMSGGGDIAAHSWDNSSDEEISTMRKMALAPQFLQCNNYVNPQSAVAHQAASIFEGAGPFQHNHHFGFNQNFSQTAADDKQSHQSWGESISSGQGNFIHQSPQSSNQNIWGHQNEGVRIMAPVFRPNPNVYSGSQSSGANGSENFQQFEQQQQYYRDQDPYSLNTSPQINFYNRSGGGGGGGSALNTQQVHSNHQQNTIMLAQNQNQSNARANSFDKVAKQQQADLHQNYFGTGNIYGDSSDCSKLQSQDLDSSSTKSIGQKSSFSDGAIYNTAGPGNPINGWHLGQMRNPSPYYDTQGNFKVRDAQQMMAADGLTQQQSQLAYGFYDSQRQQFSNQINNQAQQHFHVGNNQGRIHLNGQPHPAQVHSHIQQLSQNQSIHQAHFAASSNQSQILPPGFKLYNGGSSTQNSGDQLIPNQQEQQQQQQQQQQQYLNENILHQFDAALSMIIPSGPGGQHNKQNITLPNPNRGNGGGKKLYINGIQINDQQHLQDQQYNAQGSHIQFQDAYHQGFHPQGQDNIFGYHQQQAPTHHQLLKGTKTQGPSSQGGGGYKIDQSMNILQGGAPTQNLFYHQAKDSSSKSGVQYIMNQSGIQIQGHHPRYQNGAPNVNSGHEIQNVPYNIGMAAPQKLIRQAIDFSHNEQHVFITPVGPMVALQSNMQQTFNYQSPIQRQMIGSPYNPYQQPQHFNQGKSSKPPLSRGATTATTASSQGDKDLSYMRQGSHISIPQHFPNSQVRSLSGAATPQTNPIIPNFDARSNNSSSFSGGSNIQMLNFTSDQNEKLLREIIHQFETCPHQDQKFDIIRGNVHRLALEQTGSRFLQKQLNKASNAVVAFFLGEIEDYFADLMIDNYGNYFCQRLLQTCSSDQRLTIIRVIQEKFIKICCNKRGTHTIQSMFDLINRPAEEQLISQALKGHIIQLSLDSQGTHVVQKVIKTFQEEPKRQFIVDEIYDQFIQVAKDVNGICVVKKLIDIYSPNKCRMENSSKQNQKQINSLNLLKKIQENTIDLVQDPFGNYIVQEIITIWDISVCRPIFDAIKSKICTLSNQKFSSNVIELCLYKADDQTRTEFISQIQNSDKLANLVRNQFGNYVVQSALRVCKGSELHSLIKTISARLPEVTDRKIKSKWDQILLEAANGILKKAIKMPVEESKDGNRSSDDGGSFSPDANQVTSPNTASRTIQQPVSGGKNQSQKITYAPVQHTAAEAHTEAQKMSKQMEEMKDEVPTGTPSTQKTVASQKPPHPHKSGKNVSNGQQNRNIDVTPNKSKSNSNNSNNSGTIEQSGNNQSGGIKQQKQNVVKQPQQPNHNSKSSK